MLQLLAVLLVGLLIWALSKWLIYRLSFMAVLLYYCERGFEIPSKNMIQKYRIKVAKRLIGLK